MDDGLKSRLDFLAELDKMKQVLRMTPLIDGSRRENDAEHSWHMAVMLMVLRDYAAPGADVGHAVQMALVHDLVEIYAGDTFAYDAAANESKAERENAAAMRLFGMLPLAQGARLRALWEEFDAGETPSARYANAADRLQPLMNNYLSGGGPWRPNGISRSAAIKRQLPVKAGMPALWEYVVQTLDDAVAQGMLKDE